MVRALCRIHDALTQLSFAASAVALAAIVFCYCYEVVVRYLFDAPTTWANEFVSYFLCVSVFLMIPHLSRTGGHVAVTLILDAVRPIAARALMRVIAFVSFAVCLAAAWFAADETWRQFTRGIQIMAVNPVDKWIISVVIPYGLASSALYFLRTLFAPEVEAGAGSGRL